MDSNLEKDQDGQIILRPVTGWTAHQVAEILALLKIEYIESPEEFEGTHKSFQICLTAQQCLQLAETLQRANASIVAKKGNDPLM
jgi:hypothetical protein